MAKIAKEPLVIFLMIGGLLFALFDLTSWQATTGQQAKNEITVTEGHIKALALGFRKTWQRPPSEKELNNLVERYVREEVFYREAMAMGLDRDDGIVRKRMVQKLEFISEDLAGLEKPDQKTLQAYLDANAQTYRQDARYSFQQVYIASRTSAEVDELLVKLRSGQIEPDQAGDPIMIQTAFENETEHNVSRLFGELFLDGLRQAENGAWQGPVMSGYGLHLVNISERIDSRIPQLADVRDLVLRDYNRRQREDMNEAFYQALRSRYIVAIEPVIGPQGAGTTDSQTINTAAFADDGSTIDSDALASVEK